MSVEVFTGSVQVETPEGFPGAGLTRGELRIDEGTVSWGKRGVEAPFLSKPGTEVSAFPLESGIAFEFDSGRHHAYLFNVRDLPRIMQALAEAGVSVDMTRVRLAGRPDVTAVVCAAAMLVFAMPDTSRPLAIQMLKGCIAVALCAVVVWRIIRRRRNPERVHHF